MWTAARGVFRPGGWLKTGKLARRLVPLIVVLVKTRGVLLHCASIAAVLHLRVILVMHSEIITIISLKDGVGEGRRLVVNPLRLVPVNFFNGKI